MELLCERWDDDARLPTKNPGSAGYDLYSCCDLIVPARGRATVPIGLAFEIPEGHYGKVASRSGLSFGHGIEAGAGTVDPDYRGEVKVLLYNHTDIPYHVKKHDRVAQLILTQISMPPIRMVVTLKATDRGDKGFGSSGY